MRLIDRSTRRGARYGCASFANIRSGVPQGKVMASENQLEGQLANCDLKV